MVRLKVQELVDEGVLIIEFQFQYGTIKGRFRFCSKSASVQFQFQYGTIKGEKVTGRLCRPCKFQFQYGTIKGRPQR